MACRRHGTPIALSKTMKAAFVILLLSVTSAKLPAQCLACLRNPLRQPIVTSKVSRKRRDPKAAKTCVG